MPQQPCASHAWHLPSAPLPVFRERSESGREIASRNDPVWVLVGARKFPDSIRLPLFFDRRGALYADSRTYLTSASRQDPPGQVHHCPMDGYIPVYSTVQCPQLHAPPTIVVHSRHETHPERDNILYLTYLCMHVKQRCGGTYVQERCPCPNFFAEYLCAFPRCTCVRRPSYVFHFSPVQDQDGCHGSRLQGRNWKITQACAKTGATPRDNFSRRDLITAFGTRLQLYYSTV